MLLGLFAWIARKDSDEPRRNPSDMQPCSQKAIQYVASEEARES